MSARESHAGFLTMGLDLTTDEYSDEEKAQTLAWYRDFHDHGDLDLSPFAGFMLEHDPVGFKRLRRHLITFDDEGEGPALPVAAGVLMFVYTYTVLGMGKGALYEIIAVRALGATRAEVGETIRLAALQGGPRGINALAEVADDYLREWTKDDVVDARPWPDHWEPAPERFRSGIDLSADELLPGELGLMHDWYRTMVGEVPAHLDLLAQTAPRALKTQRARFETAARGPLPAQMIPLLTLHLSAVRLWPKPLRRALQMAKTLGLSRREVVTALLWAAVYGPDVVMEAATDAAGDVLEGWD